MPSTRPLKVFLCHASADKPAVHKLYHYLKERKMDPWLDAENLLPGQNWQVEIPRALLSSDVIIICLSNRSVDKEGYVQKEIKFALDKALEMPEGRIFLIPARLEECDLPHSLSTYHYVNLFEEDGYCRLLKSLRLRAEQIGATSDFPLPPNKPASKSDFWHKLAELNGFTVFSILMLFVIVGIFIFNNLNILNPTSPAPTATITTFPMLVENLPTQTKTLSPELTVVPTDVLTQEPKITPTSLLGIGSTMIGSDGMTLLFVPAGEFIMGNDSNVNEKPAHQVFLAAYWIDQTEVTNAQYAKCVSVKECTQPSSSLFGNSKFENFPVVSLVWDQARSYCEWVGRRLPTEAEWEKAARGTDGQIYPWGNSEPSNNFLNVSNATVITRVGSYPNGASPYGALDMSSNAWEWVSSLYKAYPYDANDGREEMLSVDSRVIRGVTEGFYEGKPVFDWVRRWYYPETYYERARSSKRAKDAPSIYNEHLGFRCVMDATP